MNRPAATQRSAVLRLDSSFYPAPLFLLQSNTSSGLSTAAGGGRAGGRLLNSIGFEVSVTALEHSNSGRKSFDSIPFGNLINVPLVH